MTKLEELLEWMNQSEYAPTYGELNEKVIQLIKEEKQVNSVDLADVVLSEERAELVCDNCFGEGCRYTVWNTKMACSFCGGTGKQTN
jgi:hypothetical protein